jgi:3-hydroxyacyl-CoA dehydrogenase
MINEAARILEERIAQLASDIDVVWLNGYSWPAATGGPMFWADTIGLQKIVGCLHVHADKFGTGFVLSPMLSRRRELGLMEV